MLKAPLALQSQRSLLLIQNRAISAIFSEALRQLVAFWTHWEGVAFFGDANAAIQGVPGNPVNLRPPCKTLGVSCGVAFCGGSLVGLLRKSSVLPVLQKSFTALFRRPGTPLAATVATMTRTFFF